MVQADGHAVGAVQSVDSGEGSDDEDEGALAAFGCLRAISTVLDSVSTLPDLFPQLEEAVFPLLKAHCTQVGLATPRCPRCGAPRSGSLCCSERTAPRWARCPHCDAPRQGVLLRFAAHVSSPASIGVLQSRASGCVCHLRGSRGAPSGALRRARLAGRAGHVSGGHTGAPLQRCLASPTGFEFI